MDTSIHHRLEKNYLTASAIAVFSAFLCINIYPEYHGAPQIGQSGLIALSAAMIAMMIFIVRKVLVTPAETDDNSGETPVSDPKRLRRMFFFWSACTVLLSASLIRYPVYLHMADGAEIGIRGGFSLVSGTGLILATALHVIIRWKDYRKL